MWIPNFLNITYYRDSGAAHSDPSEELYPVHGHQKVRKTAEIRTFYVVCNMWIVH